MKHFLTFCLAGFLLLSLAAFSQSGSLDPSFGTGGKHIENFGVAGFELVALVTQPDGKILVGGYADFYNTGTDLILVRFLADGTPDLAFGQNGRVVTNISSNSFDEMEALLLLPSGKILVASSGTQNTLVCYNSDGSLDLSFDEDGLLPITNPSNFSLRDMQVQTDGKILLLGQGGDYPQAFIVLRRNSNGSTDNSFDTDGIASFSLPDQYLSARSMALQSDGKILLAGIREDMDPNNQAYLITQLTATGALDNSFGSGTGYVLLNPGPEMEDLTQIQVLTNGKIVAGGYGYSLSAAYTYTVVLRLTTTGLPDTEFSTNGIRLLHTGGSFFSLGRLLPDGEKLVLSGVQKNSFGMYSLAFLRLNNDGSNDNSFGSSGIASFAATNQSRLGVLVARQFNGKYLAGGYFSNGKLYEAGLAQVLANGIPDSDFSDDGLATFMLTNANGADRATCLLMYPDNSFLVGGSYESGIDRFGFVQKYLPDGTADVSFGNGGRVNLPASFSAAVSALVRSSDGKILVLGNWLDITEGQEVVLYRLLANGSLDASFGNQGQLVFGYGIGTADYGLAMGLLSDDRIIILTQRETLASTALILYSFHANATVDAGFGSQGRLEVHGLDVDKNDYSGFNQHLLIQPNNHIVVTAMAEGNADYNIGLRRYTADGSADATFNGGNLLQTDLGGNEGGVALALQPDGKLVLLATTEDDTFTQHTAVLRYNSNGTLDNSFDGNGWLLMPGTSGNRGYPCAVRILGNGQILGAGTIVTSTYNSLMVVARLNENGSFDPEFGNAGIAIVAPTGDGRDVTQGIELQNDGKIILVGKVENNGDEDVVLVRLRQTIVTAATDYSLLLQALQVAPNPLEDQLVLSSNNLPSGTYHLRVFTVEGRFIESSNITVNGNSLRWNINTSSWPRGILMLTITGPKSQKTFRLVKQ